MPLSPSERDWRRLQWSLSNTPLREWRFFALGVLEDPRRAYNLCIQYGNEPWQGIADAPVPIGCDPVEYQNRLPAEVAAPPACMHNGALVELLKLDFVWDEFAYTGPARFQKMVREAAALQDGQARQLLGPSSP